MSKEEKKISYYNMALEKKTSAKGQSKDSKGHRQCMGKDCGWGRGRFMGGREGGKAGGREPSKESIRIL